MPCTNRSTTRMIGAATPIVSYVGSSPTANVPPPISSTDSTSIDLRPILSPKWANTTPPIGRATNPTPNVASASRVPVSGFAVGKNSLLKTRAAAEP